MNTATNVYPGMMCSSVEFFMHNEQLKAIQNGKVKEFSELSFATIQILREHIDENKEVKVALHDFHPTSEIKRVEQFTICRFGGLDFSGDIKNGELQDGEFWPCPKHGSCPHEGLLCKLPLINGERLTKTEIQLMQLTSTDKTNEVIAEEIGVPLGTFHQIKKSLYAKLKVQTKQEVTRLSTRLNIIT